MIFVTTGQRIAVENFLKGVIYKVTFTDESIAYMMCVGIGKDFVMLQSADPSLFSLTMQSSSRVSTIDIHDPTPPEPPTPIENALQYQTGEPPFTFTATGNKLFSWYIEGACGDKTANLLDFNSWFAQLNPTRCTVSKNGYSITITATGTDGYTGNSGFQIPVESSTTYTFYYSADVNINGAGYILENGVADADHWHTFNNNNRQPVIFTTRADTTYIILRLGVGTSGNSITYSDLMLNSGSTAQTFEPYGYKIPISCNSYTETIYLDEPLAEGEKLYSVNTDTDIVTDIGENTLTVGTTDTPGMQIVYDIYAEG